MENIYTVEHVAKILHLSKQCIWNYLKDGKLKGFHTGDGAGWRIKESDLKKYIDSRMATSKVTK